MNEPSETGATDEAMRWLAAELARLDGGAGLEVGDEALARFEAYLALLLEWNERAGLTSVLDPLEVVRRHFAESVALLVALRRAGLVPAGARVIDLGSGGGFPGLPAAIVDRSLRIALLEANARRARFLESTVEALGLPDVEVVQARAEDAARDPGYRERFDLALARALAPLPVLVEYALPFLRAGGVLATPKGSRAADELLEARAAIEALGGTAEPPLDLPLPEGSHPQQVVVVRRGENLDARFPRRAGIPSKRPLG